MTRRAVPLLAVALLFGTAGAALAQVPPIPPLPPTPPLPVPVPPVPVLPPSPPPPPPSAPQPAPPPPSLPDVTGAVGSAGQTVTGTLGLGATSGAAGSGSSGAVAAQSGPPRTRKVRVSGARVRNTGDRRDRTEAVVTFSLARPALVRFRIQRVAPDCALIGRFTMDGQSGLNTYRFSGRFRGVTLPAGTYHLSANAFRRGRFVSLGRAIVVIVPAGEDSARPQRSTCSSGTSGGSGSGSAAAGDDSVAAGEEAEGRADEDVAAAEASGTSASGTSSAGGGSAADGGGGVARDGRILGVLPNPFEEAPSWLQPLLLLALGFAILMLLAAALPAAAVRPAGAAPVVSRRRSELALLGAMVLGIVAITALVL